VEATGTFKVIDARDANVGILTVIFENTEEYPCLTFIDGMWKAYKGNLALLSPCGRQLSFVVMTA